MMREELPIILNAKHISQITVFAKSTVFEIMKRMDFPLLEISNRKVCYRDSFFEWLDSKERGCKKTSNLNVLAPVHDAILIEADLDCIQEVVKITQQALAEASEIILDGFTLRSSANIVCYPDRYVDERGRATFERIISILERLNADEVL